MTTYQIIIMLIRAGKVPIIKDIHWVTHACVFEKDFKSGKGAVFAIEKDSQYIGYIFVLTFTPGMEKASKFSPAYISDLHIEKSFRRKGFAKKLIKEAEKWAKSKNKKEISLDVGTFNKRAINLYKKSKFQDKSIKLEKKLEWKQKSILQIKSILKN